MKRQFWFFLFILVSFCGCSSQDSSSQLNNVAIAARDEGIPDIKPIVYRIKVPKIWIQQNPSSNESIADTTKAITEFFIHEGPAKIRIAIHNFPSNKLEQRIPPIAQISRWKKQFQSLNEASISIKPQAFGGYSGLLFEATGQMQGAQTSILGWVLQLTPEHYRNLSLPVHQSIAQRHRQMRGDVTIKAVGPADLMAKYRENIMAFARSFQLIDDMP